MKRNIIVVACLLVLALLLAGISRLVILPSHEANGSGSFACVKIDGEEYERIPLDKPGTFEITQENGDVNVVEVTEKGVRMAYSNCHNQQCVLTGEVTRENIEYLPNQGFIVCLPHRLSVEVVFTDSNN